MTKIKLIIAFVVMMLLSGAVFYYASSMNKSTNAAELNARKEDTIYLQNIAQTLNELNNTLTAQLDQQKLLEEKLAGLEINSTIIQNKTNNITKNTSTTTAVKTSTTTLSTSTVTAPKPVVVKRVVTRAS